MLWERPFLTHQRRVIFTALLKHVLCARAKPNCDKEHAHGNEDQSFNGHRGVVADFKGDGARVAGHVRAYVDIEFSQQLLSAPGVAHE